MKRLRSWWQERIRRWWSNYQLPILLSIGLLSLILGFIGFVKNGISVGEERSFLDNLYLTLGLLSLNTGAVPTPVPWELEIARFLVPLVTAYTAVLALAAVFTQQAQQVKLRFYHDHVIICGLGRKGIRLANQFLESGERVVIIEADEGNDWIETVRSSGMIVLNGDASDPEMLQKVRVNHARYLVAVTGSDGTNADVAVQAEKLSLARENGVLTCIIHIVDPQLWYLLREKELYVAPDAHFRLELFNIFDHGASILLKKYSPWDNDEEITPNNNHLMLIGLGNLGQSLVSQASLRWQELHTDDSDRIKFTIIDLDAEEKIKGLYVRYPHLEEVADLKPLQMNVHSADFHQADFLFNEENKCNFDSIFICIDDDSLCLHIGLVLYQRVRDINTPVIVRMVEDAGLALLLRKDEKATDVYHNLHAFPLLDQTCTPDLVLRGTHEVLARELHESYLLSLSKQKTDGKSSPSHSSWDELPEDTKEWNRKQADRISFILENHGYRIAPLVNWKASNLEFIKSDGSDEVEAMARMEHEMWCKEMRNAGWRQGSKRSKQDKTNPDLVPWEKLPTDEITKNLDFICSLPRLLVRTGFQIEKKN